MEAFLTFILFFALFIWLLRRILPWLLTWWLRRKMGLPKDNSGRARARRGEREYREGEVRVNIHKREPKRVKNDVGEYIDFEEKNSNENLF